MDDCCNTKQVELEALAIGDRRRVLQLVLAINAAMFAAEFGAGVVARSTALMADSLDMFGDALVYGLSLYALSRGDRWKAGAALVKGGAILLLSLWVIVDIVMKLRVGVVPESGLMAGFGALALAANGLCLALLWRHRSADVNMSSTFECSRNDVVSNLGVLLGAAGVWLTGSGWPDILVGAIIVTILLRSAVRVIASGWTAWRAART